MIHLATVKFTKTVTKYNNGFLRQCFLFLIVTHLTIILVNRLMIYVVLYYLPLSHLQFLKPQAAHKVDWSGVDLEFSPPSLLAPL